MFTLKFITPPGIEPRTCGTRQTCYHLSQRGEQKLKVNTFQTIILAVILYGCETWSLTFREQQRLRLFENNYMEKYFGLGAMELQENG